MRQSIMRRVGVVLPILALASGCGRPLTAPFDSPATVQAILRSIPPGWSLAETKADQLPQGNEGHGGTMLVLLGWKDVESTWCDKLGTAHREPLSKESLELWIMPVYYRESIALSFSFDAPPTAPFVFSSRSVRIYGQESSRVLAKDRFREILSQATMIAGPERVDLSWSTWKSDLKLALN